MNLKASIILICALSLSACTHFKKSEDSGLVLNSGDVSQEHGDNPSEPSPQRTTNQQSALEVAQLESELSQDTSTPINVDLLDRIRSGFQLPDFKSKYIADYERWNATHPTYLTNLFKRAEPFLFHIVEEIEKRGMPMELALLPAVESAFKPNARSRSNASGLWQFVPATGGDFGLHEDWWYDGRLDAIASTDAALNYLGQLHKMFDGDWFLALAAYNAGQGTIQRAIKANRKKNRGVDYQDLRIRSETRRYVPKLIALKNIINTPEKFNVTLPKLANKAHFEVLNLAGQVDLLEFSKASKIDLNQLMHMNAGFKRWATSPNGPHRLLVPISDEQNLQIARTLSKQAATLEYRSHQIDTGDSLSSIAKRYKVSVAALKATNKLRGSNITAGKNLLIPVSAGVGEPSSTPASTAIDKGLTFDKNKEKLVHRVQHGDTLWSIAKHYQVQLQQLLAWNNLATDQILSLNQALFVFKN
jgi:membrane-bound lytic murein transglycosylase D